MPLGCCRMSPVPTDWARGLGTSPGTDAWVCCEVMGSDAPRRGCGDPAEEVSRDLASGHTKLRDEGAGRYRPSPRRLSRSSPRMMAPAYQRITSRAGRATVFGWRGRCGEVRGGSRPGLGAGAVRGLPGRSAGRRTRWAADVAEGVHRPAEPGLEPGAAGELGGPGGRGGGRGLLAGAPGPGGPGPGRAAAAGRAGAAAGRTRSRTAAARRG